jgi:hypothetical protein
MADNVLQLYVSDTNTFIVSCPYCPRSREFRVDELPPDLPNPFIYECPCGKPSSVLVNFRRTYRRSVNLQGSLTVDSDVRTFERSCTVLDISQTGMRLAVTSAKNLVEGQLVTIRVVLDDLQRTKLDPLCAIREIIPEKARFILGVEYVSPDPFLKEALGFYLMP